MKYWKSVGFGKKIASTSSSEKLIIWSVGLALPIALQRSTISFR